jgi:hypothetical protein
MDAIEVNFYRWYARSSYEAYIEAFCELEGCLGNPYAAQLPEVKDTIFEMKWGGVKFNDDNVLSSSEITQELDRYFKTRYFSDCYRANGQQIDKVQSKRMLEDLFSNEIEYRLLLPGKLVSTNAPIIHQDTLTWKVWAMRLIPGDYELTATSRTLHPWAFAATCLCIALAVYCFAKVKKYS